MKRIWIIRHAKSDHGPQYNSDYERPLNNRGRRDAPLMAKHLKNTTEKLDVILVSAAERTRETASYFIKEYNLEKGQVNYLEKLYLPVQEEIWEVIRQLDDDYHHIAVFSHNPAVEDLLHQYHPGTTAPTCSVIELHYDGEQWEKIRPENVRFIAHKYPKLYVK